MNRSPLPRVDKKRKLVYVYCASLKMHEVRMITNKGVVSKMFAPQTSFADDIRDAFRSFTVPFAAFRSVPRVDKRKANSWNGYIEMVWRAAN